MAIVMQQNSAEQPDPVQQDTLVYADIGPSSFKKRAKHIVILRPDDMDDKVEYALLNHSLQKPVIPANEDSIIGKININFFVYVIAYAYLNTNSMKMTLLILTLYWSKYEEL